MNSYIAKNLVHGALATALWLILVSFSIANASDVYKWTDADGRVHFGASVPAEFAEKAKKVETQTINTIAPEPAVKAENERAVRELKRQDAERNREMSRSNDHKAPDSKVAEPSNPEAARAQCRDSYVLVKERTECFRRVAEGGTP